VIINTCNLVTHKTITYVVTKWIDCDNRTGP
jgi:hypothetical protein